MEENGKLTIGTRIRFLKDLIEPPGEDHPTLLYAAKGEEGQITGYNDFEGYWVTADHYASAPFGAKREEFEVI